MFYINKLKLKEKLNTELNDIKKRFHNNHQIDFVHNKFRYEIEIPESYV